MSVSDDNHAIRLKKIENTESKGTGSLCDLNASMGMEELSTWSLQKYEPELLQEERNECAGIQL